MSEYNKPQSPSFFSKYKWYIIIIGGLLAFRLFSTSDGTNTSTTNATSYSNAEEVVQPTEGVITKIAETEADVFKITDEEVVADPAQSRVIASYLDGSVDTFTLAELAAIDTTATATNTSDRNHYRRSSIGTIAYYGLIGYMIGRPMGYPIRSSSYANTTSYNKAQTGATRVSNTATRRSVSTPRATSTGKSGFGSGRSTKSYGG